MTEAESIAALEAALSPLDHAARKRVLDWATAKFGKAEAAQVQPLMPTTNLPWWCSPGRFQFDGSYQLLGSPVCGGPIQMGSLLLQSVGDGSKLQ